jgi:hypothetical protein
LIRAGVERDIIEGSLGGRRRGLHPGEEDELDQGEDWGEGKGEGEGEGEAEDGDGDGGGGGDGVRRRRKRRRRQADTGSSFEAGLLGVLKTMVDKM